MHGPLWIIKPFLDQRREVSISEDGPCASLSEGSFRQSFVIL